DVLQRSNRIPDAAMVPCLQHRCSRSKPLLIVFDGLLISLLHNHDAGVLWRNTAISIAHWFDYVSRLRTAGTVDAFRHDARRMRYGARATSSSGAHRQSASGARG